MLDPSSPPTPYPSPPADGLRQAATADLVRELLTRYDEVLIVGVTPIDALMVNGNAVSATPAIDINSKFNPLTSMHSTLTGVLTRMLTNLKGRIPAPVC